MNINPQYNGEPFQIAGWRRDAPHDPVIIGWTRSPQDVDALRQLQADGDYVSIQYRSVKNKRTGDA